VLAAAALGLAFTVGDRSSGSPSTGDCREQLSVDRIPRVAGAWLVTVDFGNGPRESVMQLSVDGGMALNNGLYINPDETTSHLTTGFGAWKRIALRRIAATILIQIVADDGSLKFYEKVNSELTIEGDVLSGQGMGLVYLLGQAPLDPDTSPVQVLSGPIVGRRICAETIAQ